MKLEEAIKTALQYEGRVHNLYVDAVQATSDENARRIFKVMADEERSHIEYLQSCLGKWIENGHLDEVELDTVIPPREEIEEALDQVKKSMEPSNKEYDSELKVLRQALAAELETSAFYKRMVDEVEADGRPLFKRFMEIESGHVAIVEAEIDSVSGLGFWFGHKEFDMEG